MKTSIAALSLAAAVCLGCAGPGSSHEDLALAPATNNATIARAEREHGRGVEVTGDGIVTRLLPDDTTGGRHQRFIVRIAAGTTVLVAHNIDLAPRLATLAVGDRVAFKGIYEWNPQGGVVHWTHHDPGGRHPAGWLRHNGATVQ